jgi:hypothetical protein
MPGTGATIFGQLPPPMSAMADYCGDDTNGPYRAFLRFFPESDFDEEHILRLCLRSSERVERLGPGAVLLDLGICGVGEARTLCRGLLSRLGEDEIAAQAGIGPTGILAQLVHLLTLAHRTFVRPESSVPLITAREKFSFIQCAPVKVIPRLYPGGIISPNLMARLDQYGLRTFGQIARLGESALRRQFGMAAGAFLAAIAIGDDPRPFSPALLPPRQGLRLRFATPASPERLQSALPYLGHSASNLLRKRGLQARRLRIRIRWAEGDTRQMGQALRRPIADTYLLVQELCRMTLLLLANHPTRHMPPEGEIEELQLFLEDEISAGLPQQNLWPAGQAQPAEPHERERKLAALLTMRGIPLFFRSHLSHPDAVFPEERYSRKDFTAVSTTRKAGIR